MKIKPTVFFFTFLTFFNISHALSYTEDYGTINVRPMENFSGLKASEILSKRTSVVFLSKYFGDNPDYKPSLNVFKIENNLPWISAYEITCEGLQYSKNIGNGLSKESIAILNPELLYTIQIPSYAFKYSNLGCDPVDYLIPNSINYHKKNKEISVHVTYHSFINKNKKFFSISLNDSNAKDLGFNFAFTDDYKNISFDNAEMNLSTNLLTTNGVYHYNKSTKCNDYSPFNSGLKFTIKELPAYLAIKLWKQKPNNTTDEEDILYTIHFE